VDLGRELGSSPGRPAAGEGVTHRLPGRSHSDQHAEKVREPIPCGIGPLWCGQRDGHPVASVRGVVCPGLSHSMAICQSLASRPSGKELGRFLMAPRVMVSKTLSTKKKRPRPPDQETPLTDAGDGSHSRLPVSSLTSGGDSLRL
jgi:hypothetical protein